jgi:hypothetical protein
MTDQDLSREWARSQIEAWADGSLAGESLERMHSALANDARLRAAAERAVAVRRALRDSPGASMPAGLRLRLLAIPGNPSRTWFVALPAMASALAAAIVGAVFLLRPDAPPPIDQRVAAVQDFELAMRYLRDSASVTQTEVTATVGARLRDALVTSRESLERSTKENGG